MTMASSTTILVPARNAASTIARALASADAQGPQRIVLIDDASTDDTVTQARRAGVAGLDCIGVPADATLGAVRSIGLASVDTEFGMWIDADDEVLPGRLERLVGVLRERGADLAYDGVELRDGSSGGFVRLLPIPSFLHAPPGLLRLFERNYLPAPGAPAFRTDTARALNFDHQLHGAEDFDFLLRAVAAGRSIVLDDRCGYRQFSYPSTLSRDRDNQQRMVRTAMHKHDPSAVRLLFEQAGCDPQRTEWALTSFLIFRGDLASALHSLQRLESMMVDPEKIDEPDGPMPYPEAWRLDFQRGTLHVALGEAHAGASLLQRAVDRWPAAEALNNLGVAVSLLGERSRAAALFDLAMAAYPHYNDAVANRGGATPLRVTLLQLRREPHRSD